MEELFELLMEEKKETERVLARISRDLKRLPEGKLEVATARGKYVQYYAVIVENGQRTRKYLAKKDRKIAELLVQRDYEVKLKKVAEERLDTIDHALQVMKKTDLKEMHRRMKPARQALILPLIPTDEQYIEQWYEEHRGGKNSIVKATPYTTLRGECVRSKSEKMIADAYYTNDIPYVYEPRLRLRSGRTMYPDFAVLNVRMRKTMYHEHFGMMDDEEYRGNAIEKMRSYNANGLWPGATMLYTFEGEAISFDQEELERIIRDQLL